MPKEETKEGRPGIDWFFISLVLILIAGLAFLAVKEKQRKEYIAQQIQEQALRIAQEEQPRREKAAKVYALVAEEIERSLPRVVFLGDEYMAGNQKGSVSFQFLRYVSQEMFGQLNVHLNPLVRQMNLNSLRIPVENLGVMNETMALALARFGGNEICLKEDLTLPARGDPVPVDFCDERDNPLLVAKQPLCHFGVVTIGGVEGFIYSTGDMKDALHYQTAFRPLKAPEEDLFFPAGEKVYTQTQNEFQEDCLVLFFGNNRFDNGATNAPEEAEPLEGSLARSYCLGIRKILLARAEDAPPVVVMGRAEAGSELDQIYERLFGDRYVRVTDKELDLLGRDDFTRMAMDVYDCLESQGCFTAIEERVEEALRIWSES